MAARWYTLKELVDLQAPGFSVSATAGLNLSTYEWTARHVSGFSPDIRVLTVTFGSLAGQLVGAQVRLRQIGAGTNQGDYTLYSMLVNAYSEDIDGYADTILTSAAWNEPGGWVSPAPIPMSPDPSTPTAFIPAGAARFIVDTISSSDGTNGFVLLEALLAVEVFADLATSSFWTDFIGTAPG